MTEFIGKDPSKLTRIVWDKKLREKALMPTVFPVAPYVRGPWYLELWRSIKCWKIWHLRIVDDRYREDDYD